jgi:Fe-S oxidoreductase
MPREYGFSGCVDCNRCVIYCPAKINYRKVIERVRRDYEKKGKR